MSGGLLSQLQLPQGILQFLQHRKITELYSWQTEALARGIKGNNLLYSAPTSGGKSMVAELLMILRLEQNLPSNRFQRKKAKVKGLFVVPYISVVREKAEYLASLLSTIGLSAKGYFGNEKTIPLMAKGEHVAVCTMEKANSAVNKLLEEKRTAEVYCAIIDELHMIGDKDRGLALECCISRLLQYFPNVQIIAMSATLGGLEHLSQWLRAELYVTNYRPVQLQEYCVFHNEVYRKATREETQEFVFQLDRELQQSQQGAVVQLVQEVIDDGHSVLVFCSSRNGCSSCAKMISVGLDRSGEECWLIEKRQQVLQYMLEELGLGSPLPEPLSSLILNGVAYHHAGLSQAERNAIEFGYRQGVIDVLCATTTLAAGVNLPARRVIVRSLKSGLENISRTQYLQMIGRAGRAGQASIGEAYVLCDDWDLCCTLMTAELPVIKSSLLDSRQSCKEMVVEQLEKLLLENICNGSITTHSSINPVLQSTLVFTQMPIQRLHELVQKALLSLRKDKKLIGLKRFNPKDLEVKWYTKLKGLAIYRSGFSISTGLKILHEIEDGSENGWLLDSQILSIYIVLTCCQQLPFQIADWQKWGMRLKQLLRNKVIRNAAKRLNITEECVEKRVSGARNRYKFKNKHDLGIDLDLENHVRFLAATCINDLLGSCSASKPQEFKDVWQVADEWAAFTKTGTLTAGDIWRVVGEVQQYSAMSSILCETMDWWLQATILGKLALSAKAGASQGRLHALLEIGDMKPAQALSLYEHGISSPSELAGADVKKVEQALLASIPKTLLAPKNGKAARLNVGVAGSTSINILVSRLAHKLMINAKRYVQNKLEQINLEIEFLNEPNIDLL